jgi:hypothetical protein
MKKLLAVICVGAVMGLFMGCGDPTASDTCSFNNLAVGGTLVPGGGKAQITGTLEGSSTITEMVFSVEQGGVVVSDKFFIDYFGGNQKTSINLQDDAQASIKANAGTSGGTYTLKIVAKVNGKEFSGTVDFSVSGNQGTPVTTGTVTIGSYDNPTTGSSVDLDNGTVMLAAAATAANSGVDIVGTYSASKGGLRIFTPVYAKNSSGITAFAGWVNPNNTLFHKVTVDFNSITTKEQIQAKFDATLVPSDGALTCATGDVIVVKTDMNAYVLIQIGAFDATATGTATIKYGK